MESAGIVKYVEAAALDKKIILSLKQSERRKELSDPIWPSYLNK